MHMFRLEVQHPSIEYNATPLCKEDLVYEPTGGVQEVSKQTTFDSKWYHFFSHF